MARWLLKTEPSAYSFDDLSREKKTTWDGVANAAALKNLRAMKKGDQVFIYHTGDEKAVVGTASVAGEPYPDPKTDDEKIAVIDLKVGKKLPQPVTLAQIKSDKAFAGWDLVRIGRLSIVPVSEAIWNRIEQLAKGSNTR